MGRHSCCYKQKLRKGLWSPEEDEKLLNYITKSGHGCWSSVPKLAGLQRCGKSCRLRWINYLRPELKKGPFSQQEEELIIKLHGVLGNRWSQIAAQLPRRTDNEIKNLWNSCIKKKLRQQGIDPNSHKPLSEKLPFFSKSNDKDSAESSATEVAVSSNPPAVLLPERFPLRISKSSRVGAGNLTNAASTHDYFHESSASSRSPSAMVGNFSFATNPSPILCFNPNPRSPEMASAYNFNLASPAYPLPKFLNPTISHMNEIQTWPGSSNFSRDGTGKLYTSKRVDDDNSFAWGLTECGKQPDKATQTQIFEALPEDMKWSDCSFHFPFL